MPELNLGATIQTARINELPNFDSYGPVTTDDLFVMWLAAFNKTVKIDGLSLYNFFQGGGGGTTTPVILGDKYVHVVTGSEDGGDTVLIPSLAGQQFFLERDGFPFLVTEFEILNAGGFKLLIPGDALIMGQRFTLHLYSLQGGTSGGTTTTTTLLKGAVSVATNTTFDVVNHVNKLIQLRGGSTQITFTLPDIADIPENTIIAIEAMITNTVEQKIATQAGQLVYLNNTSKSSVYMRAGEVLWLFRGTDGFYVINDFARIYRELARPFAAYAVGLNELVCKGQLVNRSDYPRLWECVQTLGSSLISDALWSTNAVYRQGNTYTTSVPGSGAYETILAPYRGCFSTGDGSTTFRIPDLMNMALRGVKTETGTDHERYYNKPGGFQPDGIGPHTHTGVPLPLSDNDRGGNGSVYSLDNEGETENTGTGIGNETRMENVGVLWVIKV